MKYRKLKNLNENFIQSYFGRIEFTKYSSIFLTFTLHFNSERPFFKLKNIENIKIYSFKKVKIDLKS